MEGRKGEKNKGGREEREEREKRKKGRKLHWKQHKSWKTGGIAELTCNGSSQT